MHIQGYRFERRVRNLLPIYICIYSASVSTPAPSSFIFLLYVIYCARDCDDVCTVAEGAARFSRDLLMDREKILSRASYNLITIIITREGWKPVFRSFSMEIYTVRWNRCVYTIFNVVVDNFPTDSFPLWESIHMFTSYFHAQRVGENGASFCFSL